MKDEIGQLDNGVDGVTIPNNQESLQFIERELTVKSVDRRKKGSNWMDNHDEEKSPLPPGIK